MLKHISVIVVLCVMVLACSNAYKPKKPDNLIPKDQMTELLYDLYVINAAKGVNRKILETNGFNPETYILTKYNIDSTQFADSNTYYSYKTEVYDEIVEKVKARLEKEKEVFEEIKEQENDSIKKRRDSISSAKKISKKLKDSIKKTIDSLSVKKLNPKDLFETVDSLRQ